VKNVERVSFNTKVYFNVLNFIFLRFESLEVVMFDIYFGYNIRIYIISA